MNLLRENSFIILIFMFFYSGCTSNTYEEYYKKTDKEWNTYLKELTSGEDINLQNTVLLILKSSECTPSIQELKWWDNYNQSSSSVNIQLIILEKYATTFETFLAHEKLQIPALRDSAGILFRNNLLPATPLKVYINEEGVLEKIATIGNITDYNQDSFIDVLPQ